MPICFRCAFHTDRPNSRSCTRPLCEMTLCRPSSALRGCSNVCLLSMKGEILPLCSPWQRTAEKWLTMPRSLRQLPFSYSVSRCWSKQSRWGERDTATRPQWGAPFDYPYPALTDSGRPFAANPYPVGLAGNCGGRAVKVSLAVLRNSRLPLLKPGLYRIARLTTGEVCWQAGSDRFSSCIRKSDSVAAAFTQVSYLGKLVFARRQQEGTRSTAGWPGTVVCLTQR